MEKYKVYKKNKIGYYFFEGQKHNNINLVIIHGVQSTKGFLVSNNKTLSDYNQYYIDLPGHGDSDDTGYTADNYINSIMEFIKDLDNVVLIGHSMGGALTVGVLDKKPNNVIGAVIAGGALDFNYISQDLKAQIVSGNITEGFEQYIPDNSHPDIIEAVTTDASDEVALKDLRVILDLDVSKGIDEVEVPVKVISGREDKVVPPYKSEEIAARVKNGEFVLLNNHGHRLAIICKQHIKFLVDTITSEIFNN